MFTKHLQPLQALVMVATQGDQSLIAGQSNRWRGSIICLIGLKGIERIKTFLSGQLTRQKIWIQ
jgi:hypothetical protein